MKQHDHQVLSSEQVFDGRVIGLRSDQVTMPGGTVSQRDIVVHPGAVGIVALDARRAVLLVTQYRHPVERRLRELPAGLLDVPGEPALLAAQRELAEEAGLAADRWYTLLDLLTSPGMSDETIRIFLAVDVRETAREVQEHEEVEMTTEWVDLDVAAQWALTGRLESSTCVAGVLAAARLGPDDYAGLRPPDAPWPARKA